MEIMLDIDLASPSGGSGASGATRTGSMRVGTGHRNAPTRAAEPPDTSVLMLDDMFRPSAPRGGVSVLEIKWVGFIYISQQSIGGWA
jgi:hypothetical protein